MTTGSKNKMEELESLDPTNLSDQEVYDFALEWTNLMRGKYNLPQLDAFPKANPGISTDCTLARALRDINDHSCTFEPSGRYSYNGESAQIKFSHGGKVNKIITPKVIGEFVRRFDDYRYPNLIQEPEWNL